VRQAGVQPIADGRPGLCVEAEQLLVPVPHSIRRQRPLAVVFEWDGPRAHLRPYLEAAACTGFISSFGACRGRHRWRSTRSYRGKLAGRISGDHLALGRFCDQFLNALDGLYKGRIIAQTAPESATGDTPLGELSFHKFVSFGASYLVNTVLFLCVISGVNINIW